MPRTSEAVSCADGPRARRAASCIEKSGDRGAGASRLPRPETCRPARVTPEPDGEPGSKPPFAVVYGATGLAGRQLMEALGRRGFEGLCLSRRSRPAPHGLPPGFSWKPLRKEEDLCVPSTAVLFSLVPITALPALLERTGGGSRLIALSSSSVRFKAESSDPWERRQAQALSRAEQEVRRLCRKPGDRPDHLPPGPHLRSRPRPQRERDRGLCAAFRVLPRRSARYRTTPAGPCRRRGAGHGGRRARTPHPRRAPRTAGRRDPDLPGEWSAGSSNPWGGVLFCCRSRSALPAPDSTFGEP